MYKLKSPNIMQNSAQALVVIATETTGYFESVVLQKLHRPIAFLSQKEKSQSHNLFLFHTQVVLI